MNPQPEPGENSPGKERAIVEAFAQGIKPRKPYIRGSAVSVEVGGSVFPLHNLGHYWEAAQDIQAGALLSMNAEGKIEAAGAAAGDRIEVSFTFTAAAESEDTIKSIFEAFKRKGSE